MRLFRIGGASAIGGQDSNPQPPFFLGVGTRGGPPNTSPGAFYQAVNPTFPVDLAGYGLFIFSGGPDGSLNADAAAHIDTREDVVNSIPDPAHWVSVSAIQNGDNSNFVEDYAFLPGFDTILQETAQAYVDIGRRVLMRPFQESLRGEHFNNFRTSAGVGQVHSHVRSVMMAVAGFPAICDGWIMHLNDTQNGTPPGGTGNRNALEAWNALDSPSDVDFLGVSIFDHVNIEPPTGRAYRMLQFANFVEKPLGVFECGPGQGTYQELGTRTPNCSQTFFGTVMPWIAANCKALVYNNGDLVAVGPNVPEGRITLDEPEPQACLAEFLIHAANFVV